MDRRNFSKAVASLPLVGVAPCFGAVQVKQPERPDDIRSRQMEVVVSIPQQLFHDENYEAVIACIESQARQTYRLEKCGLHVVRPIKRRKHMSVQSFVGWCVLEGSEDEFAHLMIMLGTHGVAELAAKHVAASYEEIDRNLLHLSLDRCNELVPLKRPNYILDGEPSA